MKPASLPTCALCVRRALWCAGLGVLCVLLWSGGADACRAQEAQTSPDGGYTFVLRGVALDQALESFSETTGRAVAYAPRLAEGQTAYCVARKAPAEAVLRCILQETGLDFYRLSSGTYVLTAPPEMEPVRGHLMGLVADRQTGAPIANAHVQLTDAGVGTVTGPSGRFTFPALLPGRYVLRVSHVGYRTWQDTLQVAAKDRTRARATLQAEPVAITPVVIDGIQPRHAAPTPGHSRLDPDAPPAGLGASPSRPLRQLSSLPGVRVSDLTADVHIQGGSAGHNQLRLDDVPVHLSHTLLGVIGPFSPFAIDRVTVAKAGFDAGVGSQLAGFVDARHHVATQRRLDVQADPLSVNARLQLTPSLGGTEEIAVMGAARLGLWPVYAPSRLRTTLREWSGLDPFLLASPAATSFTIPAFSVYDATDAQGAAPAASFTDLHAASRIRLSPLHTLHISGYHGRRRLTGSAWSQEDAQTESARRALVTADDAYRWTNTLGQVRHDAVLGPRTLLRTQLQGSHYRLRHGYAVIDSLRVRTDAPSPRLVGSSQTPLRDENSVRRVAIDGTLDHAWGPHHLRAGATLTWTTTSFALHGVRLGTSLTPNPANTVSTVLPTAASTVPSIWHTAEQEHVAGFVSDRITLSDRWEAQLGTRLTYSPSRATVYAEPRFALRYDHASSPLGLWSMRTAAGLYRQFTHQADASVLNAGALLPDVRVWIPLDGSVAPPKAVHLTHEMLLQPHTRWRLRAEGYLKHQPRTLALRYAPANDAGRSGTVASQHAFLTPARGHAYGSTLQITWDGPHVQVRGLYEYSHAFRRSDALFGGRGHPVPWNVPHRAELGIDWTPNPHWTMSLRGRALWGRRWGFRRVYYDYFGHSSETQSVPPFDLDRPGNHRLPPLYQFDASLAHARKVGSVTLQARLEVLNVTGRDNVADWRLARAGGQWRKAPRYLPPRLPTVALRLQL